MVERVRQEYLQDVEQLMKGYLETNRQDWIQENFKNPASWCDLGFFEFTDDDEMVLKVRPKRTGDNGTIAQNKKGDFLLNSVDIEGRLQYFIAFCFQEGELVPDLSFFDAKPAAQYGDNYIGIDYGSGFNLKEWRGYIMNKYGIYPPNLDGAFAAMLATDLMWITGGLAIGELAAQVENEPVSELERPIEWLRFPRGLQWGLHQAGVKTIRQFIQFYEAGFLFWCEGCGPSTFEKFVEPALARLDIPKVEQRPKRTRRSFITGQKDWFYTHFLPEAKK